MPIKPGLKNRLYWNLTNILTVVIRIYNELDASDVLPQGKLHKLSETGYKQLYIYTKSIKIKTYIFS